MKKIIYTICVAFLLTACQQEEENTPGGGKGYIALSVATDEVAATRAMQDVADISNWYAVVTADGTTLYDNQIGSTLTSQPFEPGTYTISVRSHADAEAANAAAGGWGEAYHTGTASDIEVSAGGTAYVHVACGRAQNAKLRLDYAAFSGIIDAFTISTPKQLTFAYADGTLSREAFFPPLTTLTYTITYTIAGETKTTMAQQLTLGAAATVSTLRIKSDISGGVSVSLTCDDAYEGDDEAVIDIDGAGVKGQLQLTMAQAGLFTDLYPTRAEGAVADLSKYVFTLNGTTISGATIHDLVLDVAADGTAKVNAGTYTLTADNREAANHEHGSPWYRGTSEPFTITVNETTPVSIALGKPRNARLMMAIDESFTALYEAPVLTLSDGDRSITLSSTEEACYFIIPASGALAYSITAAAKAGSHATGLTPATGYIDIRAGYNTTITLKAHPATGIIIPVANDTHDGQFD